MAGQKLTINEALITQKTLQARHSELVQLRNQNAHHETRYYGSSGEKQTETAPTYDVVGLDRLISNVARELRRLDMALKRANAQTVVDGYEYDDLVLGEVAAAATKA